MKQQEWTRQADQWSRIGPPLRPSAEDVALVAELATPALADAEGPSVAVLGVTPELVQLPWPTAARITAVDSSARMIGAVWTPHPARASAVVRARWQEMPLQARCLHVAVGDGSLNVLPSTKVYDEVLGQVARVLRPSGRLILRCFVRVDPNETVEQVAAAAMAGEISSFHALKWRLAMAIPVDRDFQLPVRRIYSAFCEQFPDRSRLARAANWSQATIGTIDIHGSADVSFTFPDLATMLRHASRWFELVDVKYGTYELAERCPTLCLALRCSPLGSGGMTAAGHPEQAPVKILGQVAVPGFQFGLRHASITIRLALAPPPGDDRPARVQALLVESLSKQGYDATPRSWAAETSASLNWTLIIMHWVLQLQQAARLPVFERGKVIYISSSGDHAIGVVSCLPRVFKTAMSATAWLVRLFNAGGEGDSTELLGLLPEAIRALESFGTPPMTYQFLQAAHRLEMPSLNIVEDLFQFGYGVRGRRLFLSGTDETSSISTYVARNKEFASQIMRQFGVPTPVHEMAATEAEAVQAAERIGYPVVVKPSNLDRGVGVATDLRTADEVRAAFVEASKHSTRILVEKHIEGDDYRLVIFRGQLILAIRRMPGGVTGDGASSIESLVQQANADPRRGTSVHKPWRLLALDEEALTLLERSGRTPESVPQAGEFVRLRHTGNVARGGTPVDILDAVHPDNRRVAERAAAAVRLDVCGVDMITPDITRSWRETGGAICEVNAGPDLGQVVTAHLYPLILQRLVLQGGRIPTAVVLGADRDCPVVANIVDRLTAAGLTVGWVDRAGVSVGRERVADGPLSAYEAGRMLLFDQSVQAVVLDIEAGDVMRFGLPAERYDVLLLAGRYLDAPETLDAAARSQLLDNAFHAVVAGCTGAVLRSADAAMIPRQGPYAGAGRKAALGLDQLVEGAVAILARRAADLNLVVSRDVPEMSGSGKLLREN